MDTVRLPLTRQQLKNLLRPILSEYPIAKAVVLGSYARGDATTESDVDLVIDSEGVLCGMNFLLHGMK